MLAIHGGAGVVRAGLSDEDQAAARAGLERALLAGHAKLRTGAPALDAVVAAITVLEDDPAFNAGRGAVFTHEGRNELDASLMDGRDRNAGAIAGVQRVRNPILLARAVMERSPHVMLAGRGAEAFAEGQGIELVDPSYFRTERRWEQLQRALRKEAADGAEAGAGLGIDADAGADAVTAGVPAADREGLKYVGTVGAVALDAGGHLAAGTSTGGMTNKRWGRIGDSPVIGAGTWADEGCAVSGTGWGEFYLRTAAAHEVCARVRHRGEDIATAAEAVINGEVVQAGGDGGAIALDAKGRVAFPFNTEGMYRGWIGADGVPRVAVFADEALVMPGD
ncbi:isoaspartyl peptidase/L-asparaginase family protein [Luteimonas padinae]|uniref:Isoaspartyl peptidase/L-asparaginase family protein n=1 Tax=Luteimonas padinae TaxID=1714359 RepID=A0ABV6SVU2_9GAMM|nr:isoaspartyl peptidase/L-asparaginase [Luteimonas padinae]